MIIAYAHALLSFSVSVLSFCITGEYQDALKHLLEFHGLTCVNRWHTDSGERLHPVACEHLRRVYTKMAEEVHDNYND